MLVETNYEWQNDQEKHKNIQLHFILTKWRRWQTEDRSTGKF